MEKLDMKKLVFEELEVVTVGFPFCFFKALCGMVLLQNGLKTCGLFLLILSAVDIFINAANFFWLFALRSRFLGTCLFNVLAGTSSRLLDRERVEKWRYAGSSLDVLFSFVIVAGMVGFGGLKYLSSIQLELWNISVVLNVLGAGLGRMAGSLTDL